MPAGFLYCLWYFIKFCLLFSGTYLLSSLKWLPSATSYLHSISHVRRALAKPARVFLRITIAWLSFGCKDYPESHLHNNILQGSLLTSTGQAWMLLWSFPASQTLSSMTLPYWKEQAVAGQVLPENSADLQTNQTKPCLPVNHKNENNMKAFSLLVVLYAFEPAFTASSWRYFKHFFSFLQFCILLPEVLLLLLTAIFHQTCMRKFLLSSSIPSYQTIISTSFSTS